MVIKEYSDAECVFPLQFGGLEWQRNGKLCAVLSCLPEDYPSYLRASDYYTITQLSLGAYC